MNATDPSIQPPPAAPGLAGVTVGLAALAALPADAPLAVNDLARLLGCCAASVRRAARRGELPPPIRFMGRHVWTAGAILQHLGAAQAAAVALAGKGAARIRRNAS